jgi:hypothetical protein
MYFARYKRVNYRGAAVFCLLYAIMAVAPAAARAGCGHNVSSGASRLTRRTLSDLIVPGSLPGDAGGMVPAGPMRVPACSGLACSRDRGLPDAPSIPSRVRSEPVCWSVVESARSGPEFDAIAVELLPAHPRHSTSPPERPPRIA